MLRDSEKDILNAVSIPVLVMNGSEIFFSNQSATRLFDLTHPESARRLVDALNTCIHLEHDGIHDGTIHTLQFYSSAQQQQTLKITVHKLPLFLLLTIRDITREVQLVQEFILLKKELDAQKILKKKRDDDILKLQRNMDLIWHAFPEGLAIIDNKLNIIETNLLNKNDSYGNTKRKKCYEIIGKQTQCDGCPLMHPSKINSTKQLICHKTENGYITEECIPSSNIDNYVLVFKDTTKQIKLIEKIKEQQNTIEHQRDIFMHLSKIMTNMHQNIAIEEIINDFLKTIIRLLNANSAILLVEGYRKKGAPWLAINTGMPQELSDYFIKEFMRHPIRNFQSIFIPKDKMPTTNYQWESVPVLQIAGRQIGILILEIINKPEDYESILMAYMDALTAYLNNKLLSMQLEERANVDGLTGLYNRSYHDVILKELKNNAIKYQTPFSAIMIDLNGLKPINDNYGHEAGDKLIITTADMIKKLCRSDDIPVRLGGDEFCILLPQTTEQVTAIVADRIKNACENENLYLSNGTVIPISLSIGYAGSDAISVEDVIKTADERMYADKTRYYETHNKTR
ncbi:MAG: GGDEF domain-containing protein [Dissulfuribacterales bacterium]